MRETSFKHTPAGIIPHDWSTLPLSDIFSFGNGYTPSKEVSAFWNNGNIPWFRVEDIRENGHILGDSIQHITPIAVKGELFPENSFIISTSATIGEYAYVTKPYLANQRFVCLIKKDDVIDDYFFLCLCEALGQWCRENCDQGSSFASVNMPSFRSHEIPIPPLDEQRKIAKALSDIDGLIDSLSKLIDKKKNIKIGTMQQLLTGKKRLEGFTEPWVEKEIGSLCLVIKGEQLNRDKMNGDAIYPVYNGGISPSGYHSDYNTAPDTVIISEGGNSCGFINFIHEPFWRGGHCYGLFGFEGNNDFFYQLLKFREKDIMKLRAGSGLPNIQKSNLNAFVVEIPNNFDEQTAIANILTDMDNEIASLEAKKEKFELIKKGMMQELLTGRVRLV